MRSFFGLRGVDGLVSEVTDELLMKIFRKGLGQPKSPGVAFYRPSLYCSFIWQNVVDRGDGLLGHGDDQRQGEQAQIQSVEQHVHQDHRYYTLPNLVNASQHDPEHNKRNPAYAVTGVS
jgi:hypothetical protein